MTGDEANTCPECGEKHVHPRNTTPDGIRFRRCPECLHSWFTKIRRAPAEGGSDGLGS